MRILLAALLALHGLIHLLGFVKAFGLAPVAQLQQPVPRPLGVLWLVAAVAFLVSAALLFVAPRWWWLAATPAVLLSQVLILTAWGDARFGTIANVLVALPLALALVELAPASLPSTYQREVKQALRRPTTVSIVREEELAAFPPAVQTWLRRAGVVGHPRVRDVRARFTGTFKSEPGGTWMRFRSEQHDFFDRPARFFLMEASRSGLPITALHVYRGPSATMRIRVAGLFDVVDARGPEMDRGETVTLFNDLCVLAPGALVGAPVRWRELDERTVEAAFTNAGHTIRATLHFDANGDLVDFVSNDRFLSADGKSYRSLPWSTPMRGFRDFGGVRLPAHGDAVWKAPEGDFVYGRFDLQSVEYNFVTPDCGCGAEEAR
jgi:hypothetical protein